MHHETHRAPLRYKLSEFFRSLLGHSAEREVIKVKNARYLLLGERRLSRE